MSQTLQLPNPSPANQEPKFILDGRYELVSLLGDGYQSRVYLANVLSEKKENEEATDNLPD